MSQTPTNNKQVSLLSESTCFTRVPNPNGEGELLEVKVTTKVRTNVGILHDTTQSFMLSGEDSSDTLASLRVIHNNLQLTLMKAQQEAEKAAAEQPKDVGAAAPLQPVQ
jgi:hypothetical protein